jgi:hypothetical protein
MKWLLTAAVAWVLWGQPQVMGYLADNRWRPLESFATDAECRAFQKRHFTALADGSYVRRTSFAGTEVDEIAVCLPDTVRPEGQR